MQQPRPTGNKLAVYLATTILVVLICAVFLAWFFAPMSGDNKIFFAAARQADFHGPFPMNVYRSWELKPLGHRAVIYGIYKAATVFSDFADKAAFEKAVKAVYGTVILLAALGFIFGIRRLLRETRIPAPVAFLTIALVFFSMSRLITLQPEEMSLLFLLAAMGLALSGSKGLNLLAGLPLAGLFTLKGVTVLLGFQVLLVLYAMGDQYRRNLLWTGLGFAAWGVVIIALFVLVFPQELQDLRNATLFQGSLEFDLKRFGSTPWAFWHKFQFAPVIAPAVVLGWLSLLILAWHKNWRIITLLAGTSAISGAVVLIQGLYFGYHYTVFVVPAVVSLVLVFTVTWDLAQRLTNKQIAALAGWASALFLGLVLLVIVDTRSTDVVPFNVIGFNLAALLAAFLVVLGWLSSRYASKLPRPSHSIALGVLIIVFAGVFWLRYQAPWSMYPTDVVTSETERQVYGILEEQYRLSTQSELLYLSGDGLYTYYFGAPTHCRYFTLEAIKRFNSKVGAKGLADSPVFRQTMDCILSYQGQYLLLSPGWDQLLQFPNVKSKIDSEYTPIAHREASPGIIVYRRQGYPHPSK